MSQSLWTIAEICAATGGSCDASPDACVTGVSIDTRTLEAGDLFVAIRGDNQDGHAYVNRAIESGAAAAIVEVDFSSSDPRCIRVPDTLRAMEALGRAARDRTRAKIIAVTGSVGKTGTKEMLRLALNACGRTHAAEKSYNNHWGVPLTLARMPRETEYGVFEIGMNHAGEITPLTQMVRPHIAIITTIAPVHIAYLGSLQAIANAKAEIFAGLEPEGTAVLNADAPHFDSLEEAAKAAGATIRTFGQGGADAVITSVDQVNGTTKLVSGLGGSAIETTIGALGDHHVTNALAVQLACQAAGVDLECALSQLKHFTAQPGRGASEIIATPDGSVTLLDESYNANPTSVRAAISVLGQTGESGARRIAILGDMLELGDEADAYHAGLAEPLTDAGVDLVLSCGPHMAHLHTALPDAMRGPHGETSDDLLAPMIETVAPGDVVMIKGSLGSRMGPLVAALRSHLTAHTNT